MTITEQQLLQLLVFDPVMASQVFFSPFSLYQGSSTICHFCPRYMLRFVLILSGSEHHD